MILDVDTGIDDALALLFALKSENIRLEGITTVFGNVSLEQATRNTLQVVELAAAPYEIPVVMGADRPLLREWDGPVTSIHGDNGIGGYQLPEPKKVPLAEHAADFIVRKINENINDLTLVFVGRLTNLAIALAKDPTIAKKARLVLMGGAVRVPGNVTPVSEANIWGDPEAAHRVFESGIPIVMVGLDVTMKTILKEEHLLQLKAEAIEKNQPMVSFIQDIMHFYFAAYEKQNGFFGSPLHDPLAVGVAIDASLVKTEDLYVNIETKGVLSAGATLVDLRKAQTVTNASVCVSVDSQRFIDQLIRVLAGK